MVKETINKTKGQHIEWEKIFANNISYERLISKIYKELIQLNIKKKKQLKNGQRTLIDIFQRQTDGQQAHEKMLSMLIIRETQTKTIIRCHFTPVTMAIIKKRTNNNS